MRKKCALFSIGIFNVYDGEWDPHATKEQHAVHIFQHYEEWLYNLQRPHDIARLLHEEDIEVAVDKITNRNLSPEMKVNLLLSDIKIAIGADHSAFLVFAQICMHTGNEDIGNEILRVCSKFL